jgi:surface antigen
MIGKPHRSKGPGRRLQLPGDVTLYRQINTNPLTSARNGGSSMSCSTFLKVGISKNCYSKEQKESLKRAINSYRDLTIPLEGSNKWLSELEFRGSAVLKDLDSAGSKVFRFVPVHNKTALILTWILMFYVLASQVSAAEAPTTVGEIVSSTSPVQQVKHDPINFDESDVKETKPNVDGTIHPVAAESTEGTNKRVSVVDGSVVSTETPVEIVKPVTYTVANGSNHFPYGYCTWYVASKRQVAWYGNAITWYSQAISYGLSVGNSPAPNAIMVTRESSLGHVAYVEAVNPDGSWVVSEMNYVGWGITSSRTIRPGTIPVIGFVY